MSRRSLNDFPKWVEENADLARGTTVFGVSISEEMTKKELMAVVGYLSEKMQSDLEQHQRQVDFIFDLYKR